MVRILKRIIRTDPRSILRGLVALHDSPHSIALGVAIGIFVGLTPTVGIQMLLVICIAWLSRPVFRFNRMAALMTVYISNPLTIVPLYFAEYKLGTLFVSGNVSRSRFEQILKCSDSATCWQTLTALCVDVGWPLLVGTLIMSAAGAFAAYPATRALIGWYHRGYGIDSASMVTRAG